MDYVLVIAILAGSIGGAAYFLWHASRKKRKKEFAAHAEKLGFIRKNYAAAVPKDIFSPLRLFCIQPPGEMENVFMRDKPRLLIFDYEYDIPRDQTVGQSVALFQTNKKIWPQIVIESRKKERFTVQFMRTLAQKCANWISGYKELDVSFYPEFSSRYRVFSNRDVEHFNNLVPGAARDILSHNPGWNVELMDQWVLIYRQGKHVKPKEIENFVPKVSTIFNAFF